MDSTELLEPVLQGGIRNTHFFNGRILTAEDLRTEQGANREQHRQLARALGEGVAYGLEVTPADPVEGVPVLRVGPGLGFNRDGDAVAMRGAVDVRLVTRETEIPPEAGLFTVCIAPEHAIELTNVGLYVLTARPASALSQERAPMAELDSEGVATHCGSRWAVEGVRFSVSPLPLAPAGEPPTPLAAELATIVTAAEADIELVRRGGASDTPAVRSRLRRNLSRLRNGTAYLCFGVDTEAARRASPFPVGQGFDRPTYGPVDGMRDRQELAPCELPLALFYLSKRGIEWVDPWSVRRPLIPALSAGTLGVLPHVRAGAEAVAMVLQFQRQVTDLLASDLTTAQLELVEAADYFRYLPPVGLVPVREGGQARGFAHAAFFQGFALGEPVRLSGEELRSLLADALLHGPLDLASAAAVQLWRIDEREPSGALSSPPYVVFKARHAFDPLVHVLDVSPEIVLRDGMDLRSDLLARGVFIASRQPIDPLAATSAACFVTVELPFPGNQADRDVYGDALIGFQPVVLAGRVDTDGQGGLSWHPEEATRELLLRGLPTPVRPRPRLPFRDEWDVIDPSHSPPSQWSYTDDDLVEQRTPSAGAGVVTLHGPGTVAISKQRLQDNPFAIDMAATVPSYGGNAPRTLGLVFNWLDANNYHVLFCRYHWIPVGFSGAFARTFVGVLRVSAGQVTLLHSGTLVPVSNSTPRDINLAVKQQGNNLLFSGRVVLFNGGAESTTFQVAGAPVRLEGQSGVGLMTRYTAPVLFTRLEVVYPDPVGLTSLVPPLEAQKTLARLTLKRSFLQAASVDPSALAAPHLARASGGHPQADFERWFWLTNPTSYGYGYGYGYGYPGGAPGLGAGVL